MTDNPRPTDLLESLDADQLRRRLDELDGDRAALIVLLRAARARQRSRRTTTSPAEQEAPHRAD